MPQYQSNISGMRDQLPERGAGIRIKRIFGRSKTLREQLVRRIARLMDTSEYKRRQTPPGIKITPRAFGRDRRLPITNRFRG